MVGATAWHMQFGAGRLHGSVGRRVSGRYPDLSGVSTTFHRRLFDQAQ